MATSDPPASDAPPPGEPLQWGHARRVVLERSPDGATVVAKRFRHPRLLQRLRDRGRARTEHRWLTRLAERGVPVPRPLGLERTAEGWVVRMEWLAGAVDLRALLDGGEAWPAPPRRVSAALGRLVAELHSAGVDHPDLHPGNLLVGPDGRAFAVDFHRARAAATDSRRLERDLVALESGLREGADGRFRLRAFHAWWCHLPADLRPAAASRRALLRRVATAARLHRRREAARQARRWLRESELCRVSPAPGRGRWLHRREVPASFAAELERRLPAGRPEGELLRATVAGRHLLVWCARPAGLRDAWCAAARLAEHRLPAARPLCARLERGGWAAFELPPGARSAASRPGAGGPGDAGLERLRRRLADRGLALGPGAGLARSAEGELLLVPPFAWGLLPLAASPPEVAGPAREPRARGGSMGGRPGGPPGLE